MAKIVCPKCGGSGINELYRYEYADDRCFTCMGSGKSREGRDYWIMRTKSGYSVKKLSQRNT